MGQSGMMQATPKRPAQPTISPFSSSNPLQDDHHQIITFEDDLCPPLNITCFVPSLYNCIVIWLAVNHISDVQHPLPYADPALSRELHDLPYMQSPTPAVILSLLQLYPFSPSLSSPWTFAAGTSKDSPASSWPGWHHGQALLPQ